jgi:hypothetical protein
VSRPRLECTPLPPVVVDGFAHHVEWTPAYEDRAKGYGIGAVRLRFVLVGPRGATQFLMSTGWYLPEPEPLPRQLHEPNGWDLGYHWPTPMYPDQVQMDPCEYLPQGTCYYDGSGVNAEPVLAAFLCGGDEAVWRELRSFYDRLVDRSDE